MFDVSRTTLRSAIVDCRGGRAVSSPRRRHLHSPRRAARRSTILAPDRLHRGHAAARLRREFARTRARRVPADAGRGDDARRRAERARRPAVASASGERQRRWRSNTPSCRCAFCPTRTRSAPRSTTRSRRAMATPMRGLQRLRAIAAERRRRRVARRRARRARRSISSASPISPTGAASNSPAPITAADTYDFVSELTLSPVAQSEERALRCLTRPRMMRREIAEAGAVVARQLARNAEAIARSAGGCASAIRASS